MRRLKNAINELGWANGCAYLLARLLSVVSSDRISLQKYYFVAQPVAHKRWLSARRGNSIVVRQVQPSDGIVQAFPRPPAVIASRFAQGALCLVASKDDEFIGFAWFTLGPYQEDEVRCRYVPAPSHHAVWDFDIYLHPEHRTGIAFLKLWDEANEFLTARGIAWSLSRISAFNGNSINSHGKMGARRMGVAVFLSIGAWQLSCSSVAPRVFFTASRARYPIFRLDAQHRLDNKSTD